MTKRFITFAAIAALLVAGCGEEQKLDFQPVAPKGEKAVSLRASVPQTKVLADNAGTFKWQNGDHITVITDGDHIRQFSTTDAGFEATFSGTIPTAENIGAYALYPASESHDAAGNMIEYHLDGDVVWSANATNMPMLGKVTGSGVKFKAIGGVLKLVLYNIPAEADYLQFVAANKHITGAFEIADASASDVIIATGTGAGANKELLIDFSANYSENKVFYIPLPTGTIDGFTLNLLDAELNELFSKTTAYNLVVAANHLILGPAVNCAGATSDVSLTNAEIVADVPSSYGSGTISSASGTWSFSKAMKQTTASITRMQIAKDEYLQLPAFSDEISSIVLHGTGNGGGQGFSGTFYVSSTSSTANQFASQAHSGALGDDVTISIPAGHTTGYILASGVFRIQSITVSFGGYSYDVPTITTSSDNMTISVGTLTRSITVGLDNPVDDLGISYILGKKDEKSTDWVSSVSIEGTNLTVTANGANGTAEDREATLTLRASGAQPKVINLKQTSALVQKPAAINVLPGNGSITASWAKDAHASDYLAYVCTADNLADPAATGIALTPELSGDNYVVTKTGLTNGNTYYVYVKVNNVSANYVADSEWAVSDAVVPENKIYYEKVTSAPADWTGTYLLVDESVGKVASGEWNSDKGIRAESISITDGKILQSPTVDEYALTVAKVGSTSNYTLYFAETSLFIAYNGSDNACTSSATSTNGETQWTISLSAGNATITNVTATTRYLRFNSGVTDVNGPFRCYTSDGSTHAVQLYKLNDPRADVTLTFAEDAFDLTVGSSEYDSFTPQTATATPSVSPITYAISGDTGIASGFNTSTGAFTLTGTLGTATIKASFAGDASHKPAEASYTVTVKGAGNDGSLEHPYTASEAKELTLNGNTGSYYISGIVTKVQYQYDAEHGTATFWIDENGTATDVFEGYQVKYFGNVKWVDSNAEIAINDNVIIYGTLTKYNTTAEITNGYLVSLNGKTKGLTLGAPTTTTDDENKQITVTWGAATGTESAINYVVNCGTQSYNANAAGSHTFTMADYGTYNISVVASSSDAVSATSRTSTSLVKPGEVVKTYTITWNSGNNSKGVSSYTDTWSVTADGLTCDMTNFNNNNNGWAYVKCGRKNNASVATIITDSAVTEAIKTVTLTIDALTAEKINSIKLYISSNGTTWTEEGEFAKATGEKSVTISSPAAGKYYKLEFDCASGSGNGLIQISKLVFSNN